MKNSGDILIEMGHGNPSLKLDNDFSDFPRDAEHINGLCLRDIASCGFNNEVALYYSKAQILRDLNVPDIALLKNLYITYAMVLDNGKWYFGSSGDIGERIHTWLKDFRGQEMCQNRKHNPRNFNVNLAKDARHYGRVFFVILGVSKTRREARENEAKFIREFRDRRFYEITGGENPRNYSAKDVFNTVKDFIYNKIDAIKV